ncbi:hypothetical protein IAD21_02619 [Abditibacteriota bacterium]|nr:hypothetical protein IAD21_02619 [Abditibacteriota bacterium]
MATVSARAPLIGALLLYFVLTAALIVGVPWNGAPDEAAHAQYIEAIVTTHALPVFRGQSPPNPGYEFHQPPLFYLLAAPLWAVLPAGVQNYSARVLSLVFGLLTIWVVWNAANLLFGRSSRASALCTLGTALSPLHQGIGAGVNNDGLAGLWAACLFYLVARAWLEVPTRRLIVTTGIVAGLGVLTKLTALPLSAWAFVAVGAALYKQGERPIPSLLPALVIALLLSAPMMIRNQFLYGDPFAYGLFSRAAMISPGFTQFSAAGASFVFYMRAMAWQILGTAWGFWGGPNTLIAVTRTLSPLGPQLPDPLWLAPLSTVVLVPLAGIVAAYKARQIEPPTEEGRALMMWWTLGAFLVFLLWANFAFAHFAGGQARYLHAAMLPLVLLVGGGLARTRTGTMAAVLLGLVMLGLSLANIFVWKTLV